jgi:hypothetical protein
MSNIIVNGRMEIDDLNEGVEVACANHLVSATPVASRWYVQFLAKDAKAHAQRVMWVNSETDSVVPPDRSERMWTGVDGAVAACRITMSKPASRVVGLDRMQLFQPVVWDELFGAARSADIGGRDVVAGSLPLIMAFKIKTNVDIEVGCTLNNGLATRNWTTNRQVRAGSWHPIEVAIPGDLAAAIPRGWGGFGLYWQIGLACGPDRLSTIDAEWNDGHYLMLDRPGVSTFLTTDGATAWITDCVLTVGRTAVSREPATLTRLRVEHYEEKSYAPGGRPGTPNLDEGAYQLTAVSDYAEDRVLFKVTKDQPPNPSLSKIYSPASGQPGYAYDLHAQRDVRATIVETGCRHMVIAVPEATAGHVYRYHWRAASWPPDLEATTAPTP